MLKAVRPARAERLFGLMNTYMIWYSGCESRHCQYLSCCTRSIMQFRLLLALQMTSLREPFAKCFHSITTDASPALCVVIVHAVVIVEAIMLAIVVWKRQRQAALASWPVRWCTRSGMQHAPAGHQGAVTLDHIHWRCTSRTSPRHLACSCSCSCSCSIYISQPDKLQSACITCAVLRGLQSVPSLHHGPACM